MSGNEHVEGTSEDWRAQAEYESLREALGTVDRQHFERTNAVIAAAAVLMGYGFAQRNGAIFLCVYVLLFYAVSHYLATGSRTLDIAAYLRVFYEGDDRKGWESHTAMRRMESWMPRRRWPRLPRLAGAAYQLVYNGLALTCSILSIFFLTSWARFVWPLAFFLAWISYNLWASIQLVRRYQTGDAERIEQWRSMRQTELKDRAGRCPGENAHS